MIKTALLKSLGFTDAFIQLTLSDEELNEISKADCNKASEVYNETNKASRSVFSKHNLAKLCFYDLKSKFWRNFAKEVVVKHEETFDETALNSERNSNQLYNLQLKEDSDFSIVSKSNSSRNCDFKFQPDYTSSTSKLQGAACHNILKASKFLRKRNDSVKHKNNHLDTWDTSRLILANNSKMDHKCNFPNCCRILPCSDSLSCHLEEHLNEIRRAT